MILQNIRAARNIGSDIASHIKNGDIDTAYAAIQPILTDKNSFRYLDEIGRLIANCPPSGLHAFYSRLANAGYIGSWVVIAKSLSQKFPMHLDSTLRMARTFIIQADVWHACDCFGERVCGPALVSTFKPAISKFEQWILDPNRWVKRAVGVGVHFWAKRSKSDPERAPQASQLLSLLEPAFENQNMDTAKGIGWGLKTLGRTYPQQTFTWLQHALVTQNRKPRSIVIRKAVKFLPADQKRKLSKGKNA